MGPEMGRAKRYAQCGLVDMSALKRNTFGDVCKIVCNSFEVTPIFANIKAMKNVFDMSFSIHCIKLENKLLQL